MKKYQVTCEGDTFDDFEGDCYEAPTRRAAVMNYLCANEAEFPPEIFTKGLKVTCEDVEDNTITTHFIKIEKKYLVLAGHRA